MSLPVAVLSLYDYFVIVAFHKDLCRRCLGIYWVSTECFMVSLLSPQAHPHLLGVLPGLCVFRLLRRGDRGTRAGSRHHVLAQRKMGLHRGALHHPAVCQQEVFSQGHIGLVAVVCFPHPISLRCRCLLGVCPKHGRVGFTLVELVVQGFSK